MALDKTTAYFPFAKGVDTKTDPKQVVPGKLVKLENGYFQTPGMIRKRPGHVALPSTLTSGAGVASFKSELLAFDGHKAQSYSVSKQTGETVGFVESASLQTSAVYQSTYSQDTAASAYHQAGGLQVTVWEDSSGGCLYSVADTVTGQKIVSGAVFPGTTASSPKVFAVGSYVVITFLSGATLSNCALKYCSINVSTPLNISAEVTVQTGVSNCYDAAVIGTSLYLGWNTGTAVSLAYLSSTLVLSSVTTNASYAATGCITVFGDTAGNCWVACYVQASSLVMLTVYNGTLTSQVRAWTQLGTSTTIRNITGVYEPVSALTTLFAEVVSSDARTNYVITSQVTLSGGTPSLTAYAYNQGLAAKAFTYGGYVYVPTVYGGTNQPTYFVMSQGRAVAKYASGGAYGLTKRASCLPDVSQISAAVFSLPFLQRGIFQAIGQTATYTYNYGVVLASLTLGVTPQTVEIANNLFISGGVLSSYDGSVLAEHNFHLAPEIISTSNVGSGSIAAGSYKYIAVYEWIDCYGQKQRSTTSLPSNTVTVAAGVGQVTVTVTALGVTSKGLTFGTSPNPVSVALYRTAAGPGTIYYRVNPTSITANNISAGVVSIVDTSSDATIQGQEQLYTSGGEVDNFAAPATLALCSYKNRLVVIPSDNPYTWWFSKQVVAGQPGFPVEMSRFFKKAVDPKGGPLTACIQMDDKLLLFKAGSVMAVVGDGPAVNGTSDDFSQPTQVASDSGCTTAASLVLMPLGVMYQSAKGISLLSRSLESSYIGAPVEAEVQNAVVLSAVLCAPQNQVRFALSSGRTVVYDYQVNEWAVYTTPAPVQATTFQGVYTFITSSGQLLQESPTTFTDNGAFYALKIQTSWLSFAGLMGYQRVREFEVLGDWKSAHNLQVQVGYDFEAVPSQTAVISATTQVTPYQYRVHLQRQTCQAVQVTLTESQTGPYGEGLDLSGLAFEVGVKRGLKRMSANQSYG